MGISYHEVVQTSDSNRARQTLEPLTNKWPKGCLGSRWRPTWEHPLWIPWRDMDLYLYLKHTPHWNLTKISQTYPKKQWFWKNASPVCWNFGSRKVCSIHPSLVWLPEGNTYGRKTPEKFTSASPENHLKMNKTHHFFRALGSKALNFQGVHHKKILWLENFRSVPPKARESLVELVKHHPFVNMLDKPMTDPWDDCVFTYIWLIFVVFCRWIYHTWILSLEEFRHPDFIKTLKLPISASNA